MTFYYNPNPLNISRRFRIAFDKARDRGELLFVGEQYMTPYDAAKYEGWDIIHEDVEGRVIATDGKNFFLVCDINGPVAAQVGEVDDGWRE